MKTGTLTEQAIDHHVGDRVRQLRVFLEMSQEGLGKALGLTFQQVQKMEKGVNRIGAGRLLQIANILKVPVTYFYEGMPRVNGADAETRKELDAASHFLGRKAGQKMLGQLNGMPTSVQGALMRLIDTFAEQIKIK
jgi:transcriptional regulator with XRE-family HTH domain